MKEGDFYGNDGLFNRYDGDASDQSLSSAFSTQEDQQIIDSKDNNEFKFSNRRLDNYHLNFSSKL